MHHQSSCAMDMASQFDADKAAVEAAEKRRLEAEKAAALLIARQEAELERVASYEAYLKEERSRLSRRKSRIERVIAKMIKAMAGVMEDEQALESLQGELKKWWRPRNPR